MIYIRNTVETDIHNRHTCWGQLDFCTNTMRIFIGTKDKPHPSERIIATIYHEICHAILGDCKALKKIIVKDGEEDFVDTFSTLFIDTMTRNKLVNYE